MSEAAQLVHVFTWNVNSAQGVDGEKLDPEILGNKQNSIGPNAEQWEGWWMEVSHRHVHIVNIEVCTFFFLLQQELISTFFFQVEFKHSVNSV